MIFILIFPFLQIWPFQILFLFRLRIYLLRSCHRSSTRNSHLKYLELWDAFLLHYALTCVLIHIVNRKLGNMLSKSNFLLHFYKLHIVISLNLFLLLPSNLRRGKTKLLENVDSQFQDILLLLCHHLFMFTIINFFQPFIIILIYFIYLLVS